MDLAEEDLDLVAEDSDPVAVDLDLVVDSDPTEDLVPIEDSDPHEVAEDSTMDSTMDSTTDLTGDSTEAQDLVLSSVPVELDSTSVSARSKCKYLSQEADERKSWKSYRTLVFISFIQNLIFSVIRFVKTA